MRHIKLLKPALVLMIVGATLASCGEKKLKDSTAWKPPAGLDPPSDS